ncbi:hypothetical protein ABI59_23405 [Acidobacteria bacterium Mor1]|nr:hypothetical protein ABI59_23405 [Acidobacteria bacterium Mor1]
MGRIRARRTRGIGFVVLLACLTGCHISNYGLITDNNQTSAGGGPGEVRNTRGKAKLVAGQQVVSFTPTGTEESLNFVRQNADGAQTLSTYRNMSVEGEATFLDDLYCSPEYEGCAKRKSFDVDASDPSDNPYNQRFFSECPGVPSSFTLSTARYYGECGRTGALSLQQKLSLWNMGTIVDWRDGEALYFDLDRSNLSVHLANDDGLTTPLSITGDYRSWVQVRGPNRWVLDATNPLSAVLARSYAAWVEDYGTETTTIRGCYQGICREWTVAGKADGQGAPDTVGDILRFAARM